MGIHADWMKILKEQCPGAFSAKNPVRPSVAFIDGQIQLMKSSEVITWDQFVLYQFALPARRMLRDHGAKTVVVAFDDYTHVPLAKGMTQAKRMKKAAPLPFHDRQQLPDMIPGDWDRLICNRTFKMRVIQLVIDRLPLLLELGTDEALVIDWMGPPMRYTAGCAGAPLADMEPIGEADLKFFRYAERYGNLLVMATDSDYVPIALLRLHRLYKQGAAPTVVIQRLHVSLPGSSTKRDVNDKPRREREFVHVNVLLGRLLDVLEENGLAAEHSIAKLCGLIALFGGTDFTRGMPSVGPRRVWAVLRTLSPALEHGFDAGAGQLVVDRVLDGVLARVYARVFATHTAHVARGSGVRAADVFGALQQSKLAASTKLRMPTLAYLRASIENANWVLVYWGRGYVPELSGAFGYTAVGRRVTYADLVC